MGDTGALYGGGGEGGERGSRPECKREKGNAKIFKLKGVKCTLRFKCCGFLPSKLSSLWARERLNFKHENITAY